MTKQPTLGQLLNTSLFIGATAYGGPALLAGIKESFVEKKKWVSEEEFLEALSLSQLLPGAYGLTVVANIGYRHYRTKGAILMALAFMAPATALMLALSWAYFRYGSLEFVKSLFIGLGALVVALLANATLQLGKTVLKKDEPLFKRSLFIGLFVLAGFFVFRVSVILLVLASAILGILFFKKDSGPEHLKELKTQPPLSPNFKKFGAFSIMLLPVIVIALAGTGQIFVAFLKIGSLVFGGGFAAIPLIQNEVVQRLHWVNLKEFGDGLALGQITPGPVLITATFIGYKVKGLVGALTATLAIFTPSVTGMVLLSKAHDRIAGLKEVRHLIKGIQTGFIGLLAAITIQFAGKNLVDIKTWALFLGALILTVSFKKSLTWAILGTLVVSIFIF